MADIGDADIYLHVHYSIVVRDPERARQLMRQLAISLTTLRVRNRDVPVVVFCHGAAPDGLAELAILHHVDIVEQPPYDERLVSLLGPLGYAFVDYLPLQKFFNFGRLAALGPTHSLYLDCDTVVLGDLRQLAAGAASPTVVAREEVGSARCIHGGDRAYLDEEKLATATRGIGFEPLPACNTGVVLFNRFPFDRAAEIELSFARWALRLGLWMALHPPTGTRPEDGDVIDTDLLRAHLAGPHGQSLRGLAIEYPSVNRWILEEVAFWAAMGEQTDITSDHFDPTWVAQGGEPLHHELPRSIWHYFSANQDGMAARLGLATTNRAPSGA